jgi:hypothetical protein
MRARDLPSEVMTMPKLSRGEAFRRRVRRRYSLDAGEEELLREIAAVLDELESLPASAVRERRLQRLLLARLLSQLGLSNAGETRAEVSRKARLAARRRWARVLDLQGEVNPGAHA